jgi:hypothetical protein
MIKASVELVTKNGIKEISKYFATQHDAEIWVTRMSENPTFCFGGNSGFAIWKG